ncbi:MAG: dihydrodipicolinate synthase family protein [Anaerolineae bacterium]|nr:dihydrodipicolinate synthase family protein [Anaerolineae bacterium]MDW8098713.1 dihydrodipicolinate synthase family protein [Anaerolineae bacterium]
MRWEGVVPAITTAFRADLSVDHEFLTWHAKWLIQNGCTGIVALGSLGEAATLQFEEKVEVLRTCVQALGRAAPVVAGISALSTAEAVCLAEKAAEVGCQGLMILPPYVYSGDWREMKAHVQAVLRATDLSCMLYNNPIAYRTDFLPEQIAELATENPNLHAIKESSADIRRITALRALLGERLAIFVGVDDLIVEGVYAGAVGWIAGLANALPRESVALFDWARCGEQTKTFELYRWFLPLLRLDTMPKFVQLIKLVQAEVGVGSARVRPPRLELEGQELSDALALIRSTLARRPSM